MLYICNIQYVDKSETPFKIRFNNHRKDVKNPNAIPDCNYFIKHNHEFNNQEIHHYRPTKKHTHTMKWGFNQKTQKTWDFSATWSDPRPKLKPCDADVSLATIIIRFCIWSIKTDVSHHILQHLYITNFSYLLRKITAETSWENSSFLLVL